MGQSSQAGQVGFGIQGSGKGTPAAATRFARLKSGSLGGNRDLLIPDPEIGGNRDIAQAYLGAVSYSGDLEFYPRMEMLALLFRAGFGAVASTFVAGTSEVQTLTITGTPTGGTFTLTYRGQTTTALAYTATAAAVVAALEALSTIGTGGVTATGGALPGTPVVITFAGALANTNPPMITAVSSLTGGTSPAIGIVASTPGFPPMGTHIITPGDTLPWLTVEERIGLNMESYQYTDAKVNTLHLECDAKGYMMGKAGLIALTQLAGFSAQSTPPIDISPMMVGSQVVVTWNGVNLLPKSWNFDLTNNIENDDFRLGSITLADLVEKRREVTMSVTVRQNNSDLWRQAMYGTSGTGPIAGPAVNGVLQVTINSFENIQGTNTPYRLILDVPNAVMKPYALTPSGDDVIENSIDISVLRPDPQIPLMTATVRNDLATAA